MSALRFGEYELIRKLGVGGMAETFVAVRRREGGFEQRVCLKRILPAYCADQDFIELFLSEARIAAQLRHNNIVGVIDFGDVEGTHYLALELIEGCDLRTILRSLPGRKLSPEIVALLATDLGYALKHAARHGVVHRDLSPGNVLVSYDGEIKLSDFGIAKALASGSHSGLVKGKVPYMSPEQASAEPVDARSDLFSLGVILHECLVGRRPFDGKTQVETLSRILQGNRHEAEVESSAAKLLDISDQLIARRPEDRTPNAEELLRSLEAITPGASARARLGELAYEAQPPQARRRSPLVAKAKGKAKAKVEEKLDAITPPSGELETVAGAKADTDRGSGNAPAETTGSNPDDHPVAAREAQPTHTGPSRRTVHLAVGVAAVMVVVAGAVAVWKLGGDASASDGAVLTDAAADGGVHDGGPSDAPAADSGASVREDVPELDAGSDTGAPDSGAVNTTVALGRGTVEVIVLPFGRVWINGRAAGETPLRRELTAGSYRIAGGASRPEVTKRVRVRPGRHSRVVLEWRE